MCRLAKHHNFSGWIMQGPDGDYDRSLRLIDHRTGIFDEPLARLVYEATGYGSHKVTVSYHITDEPRTEQELMLMTITKLAGVSYSGDSQIEYGHAYSEITGYLWTTEDLKVGGHDLIAELRSYLGKWCHFMVKVHK